MDQSGHWSGTSHGIGKPGVERDLGAFTYRTYEQQKGDRNQGPGTRGHDRSL